MRLDPHVHTRHSYDASASVRDVLAAAREAGLDGVVVTDHDTIAGSLAATRLAPSYGLFAMPGVEVSTADGHLLALGVREAPEPGAPMPETVAWVHDRGGVAVVPHPFQRTRHGAGAGSVRRAAPDAVETFNAHGMTGIQTRRAARLADRTGLPGVGGSDAHAADLVGRAYTEVDLSAADDEGDAPGGAGAPDCPRLDPPSLDPDRVLDALRAGRTRARGDRAPVRRYVAKLAHNATLRTGGRLARVRGLL